MVYNFAENCVHINKYIYRDILIPSVIGYRDYCVVYNTSKYVLNIMHRSTILYFDTQCYNMLDQLI